MTIEQAVEMAERGVAVANKFSLFPENKEFYQLAAEALRAYKELKNEPLTLGELWKMAGEPAWCAEFECWGIVSVESEGRWADKPFLVGVKHIRGVALQFEYDIENRGLTLYRHKPKEVAG